MFSARFIAQCIIIVIVSFFVGMGLYLLVHLDALIHCTKNIIGSACERPDVKLAYEWRAKSRTDATPKRRNASDILKTWQFD